MNEHITDKHTKTEMKKLDLEENKDTKTDEDNMNVEFKSYSNSSSFERGLYENRVSIRSKQKFSKCETCNKVFNYQQSLRKHQRKIH